MYGGFKKFFIDRYVIGHLYRNSFRVMWFPAFLYYICTKLNNIVECYQMRLYDNGAHDFFYFSD